MVRVALLFLLAVLAGIFALTPEAEARLDWLDGPPAMVELGRALDAAGMIIWTPTDHETMDAHCEVRGTWDCTWAPSAVNPYCMVEISDRLDTLSAREREDLVNHVYAHCGNWRHD